MTPHRRLVLEAYERATIEAERLNAIAQDDHRRRLMAFTGGIDVQLFIVANAQEAIRALQEIRRQIIEWIQAQPAAPVARPPLWRRLLACLR